MKPLFEASSETELIALNRALLEAKFSGNAHDQDVPASALVAAMSERLASRLQSIRPEWKQWFTIDPTRREWHVALIYTLSQRSYWREASPTARLAFARSILAPFETNEILLARFLAEVDDRLSTGRWFSVWRKIEDGSVRLVTKRPASDRRSETAIVAADGVSILCRDTDEIVVQDWLSQNGFEFVADGLLP